LRCANYPQTSPTYCEPAYSYSKKLVVLTDLI
jgi:hypothetical protein